MQNTLLACRKLQRKTIEEVSKETKIPIFTLRAYESNKRQPSDNRKIILCNYYKKSIKELFFYEMEV